MLLINCIFNRRSNISLIEFNDFDKEIGSISKDNRCYSMDRSNEFLDWRFEKAPYKYKKHKIYYNNGLIGYCVVRIERKFNLNIIWIMDLLINREHESQYSNVLNSIVLIYYNTSDFITSLLPMQKYSKAYLKSGFIKIPSITLPHNFYFCVNKNKYNDDDIYKLENWYMSWSLNDVL